MRALLVISIDLTPLIVRMDSAIGIDDRSKMKNLGCLRIRDGSSKYSLSNVMEHLHCSLLCVRDARSNDASCRMLQADRSESLLLKIIVFKSIDLKATS